MRPKKKKKEKGKREERGKKNRKVEVAKTRSQREVYSGLFISDPRYPPTPPIETSKGVSIGGIEGELSCLPSLRNPGLL
jgi:hypothetical protein